jgi:uncharacterized protein
MTEMNIEWDETKRLANIEKHSVDFLDAVFIFENPVIESVDTRENYNEERWQALGHVDDDHFMVVYTWRGKNRRIISAWKVNEHGKRRYKKILSDRTEGDA